MTLATILDLKVEEDKKEEGNARVLHFNSSSSSNGNGNISHQPDIKRVNLAKAMPSTHSNPFVQGGWETSTFRPNGDQVANPPSIYGALPMSTDTPSQSGTQMRGATLFQFTNPSPTILNSAVVSTHRDGAIHQLVRISTDERLAGYTAFKDAAQRSVALIEWVGGRPQVEVRGNVPKCEAGSWLKVVNVANFGRPVRRMDVKGARFYWCPNGDAILLYSEQPSSQPLAIATKNRHVINLEMSDQALAWGLLESCIVAITLLLSGKRFE